MNKTDTEINVAKCETCFHSGMVKNTFGVARACCYYRKPLSEKPYDIDCEQDSCDGFGPIYYRPGTCHKYEQRYKEADQ